MKKWVKNGLSYNEKKLFDWEIYFNRIGNKESMNQKLVHSMDW